jgi:hypothetical protein
MVHFFLHALKRLKASLIEGCKEARSGDRAQAPGWEAGRQYLGKRPLEEEAQEEKPQRVSGDKALAQASRPCPSSRTLNRHQ